MPSLGDLFGGGGGSSQGGVKSPVTTTTTETSGATGYALTEGDNNSLIAGLNAADGSTINVVDPGALASGREIALRALDLGGKAFGDALTNVKSLAERSSADTRSLAETLSRGESERAGGEFFKLAALLAVTLGVVFLVPALKRG